MVRKFFDMITEQLYCCCCYGRFAALYRCSLFFFVCFVFGGDSGYLFLICFVVPFFSHLSTSHISPALASAVFFFFCFCRVSRSSP
ncbi:hypothetical protein TRSC58_07477 [Trypanosoma rangeli SC58]|uniref:Uncharacterized protein n=1 Tax=Trypanosoma rangeli SC58 TaxID=429131 RepID=A0A061IRY1_TRYRA|nr:hypothetical protein TRSC58_07477 [Trypanosoma rangeli SC58]